MKKRTKLFWKRFKEIFENLGSATGRAMKGLEESDKKINEIMKKIESV